MTVLLAIHVFISAWLVATAEGVYTEGKPAPTEAHSLIAIDKDQTIIDVEIKQATAFFFYALERDSDASVPVNDTTPPDESGSGDESEAEDEQGRDEDRAWLSIGRQSIKFGLVFLVLSEVLMLSSFVWRHHVRSLAFLCTLVAFSVVFPACYMLESKSEYVQLEASKDLLDRAGYKPIDRAQVQVAGDIRVSIDLG